MGSMYYSCEEHVDIALDEQVDDSGMPPELKKIEQNEELSTTCSFCEKPAIYAVKE
nr:CxxH/CxxC protein [Evansella clarkii]